MDGICIAPHLYVMAVPVLWKARGKEGGSPDVVCKHVAKQQFGPLAKLWLCETVAEGTKLYAEAFQALRVVCEEAGRSCEMYDPVDYVVRIGEPPGTKECDKWRFAGLRWLRIVESKHDQTDRGQGSGDADRLVETSRETTECDRVAGDVRSERGS